MEINPQIFQLIVIANGLRLYAKTGISPNRQYTPTRMMKAAESLTNKRFAARDYLGAADALMKKVDELKMKEIVSKN